MAGIGVGLGAGGEGGARRGRKALDSELNMIPMIDLLMVTVAFLLITAVWSHMARLDANAQVPAHDPVNPPCTGDCPPERELHVDMRNKDRFVLTWREGGSVLSAVDVPRRQILVDGGNGRSALRFDGLGSALEKEWRATGAHHAATDRATDRAVLHTSNDTRYEEMVGAMDAISSVSKPLETSARKTEVPAFRLVLASN